MDMAKNGRKKAPETNNEMDIQEKTKERKIENKRDVQRGVM
jgi:hypothetical protein